MGKYLTSNYFIHIGYPKAGSSFLQKRLFTEANGVFNLCNRNSIYLRHSLFHAQTTQYDPFMVKKELNGQLDDAVFSGFRTFGISDEDIVYGFDVRLVAERLFWINPSAKVLIVIRNQLTQIVALYREFANNGLYMSLDDFVESQLWDIQHSFLGRSNYYTVASIYAGLFGEDNVKVICFEKLQDDVGGFVKEICDFLGIVIENIDPRPANPSLTGYSIVLLRLLNFLFRNGYGLSKFRPMGYYSYGHGKHLVNNVPVPSCVSKDQSNRARIFRIVHFADRIFRRAGLDGMRPVLSDEHSKSIADLFAVDNFLIQKKYGLELGKYNYPLGEMG